MLLPASQDTAGGQIGWISGASLWEQHTDAVPIHPEVLRSIDDFPASVLAPPASLP